MPVQATSFLKPARLTAALILGVLVLSATPLRAEKATESTLFGMREIRNQALDAFTKWTGMLARLDANADLNKEIAGIAHHAGMARLEAVNRLVNRVSYVSDMENWGETDHWATPHEFFSRNGDCEDFAIAKYVLLKALGLDASRMRIVILIDETLAAHHAVLMVETAAGRMILDNQMSEVVRDTEIDHYRPIYSINESAWWLYVPAPRARLLAQRNP